MAELKLDLSRVDQIINANNAEGEEADGGEGEGEDGVDLDPLSEMYGADENLPPLEKLERYFQSEDVLDRETAVHCIVDAVEVATMYSEYQLILEISMTLANDHEPAIRMSILDTVPALLDHHSRLCHSDSENSLETEERLFDVPIRMVSDINQQVRRMGQNCVIHLLEDQTKNKDVLVGQLLPEMLRCLHRDENYDLRMDMALLLSRLAPLLGQSVLVKHFVPLFPSLGSDAMFHVRKAFAMGCHDLCPVLGEALTEAHVLPTFLRLCKDDVWGVRKACADVFSEVSNCCNLGTRHDVLTPCYLRLLQDESRWVRRAAFEHLGAFIASFYVPPDPPDAYPFDESSLDPFGDSVLADNSLLSSESPAHEEDGVWVDGSGTRKVEEVVSDDDRPKAGDGSGQKEEPFFYFMHTPKNDTSADPQQGGMEERGEDGRGDEGSGEEVRGEKVREDENAGKREKTEMLQLSVDVNKESSETSPACEKNTFISDNLPNSYLPSERLVLGIGEGALIEGAAPLDHRTTPKTDISKESTLERCETGEREEENGAYTDDKQGELADRETTRGECEASSHGVEAETDSRGELCKKDEGGEEGGETCLDHSEKKEDDVERDSVRPRPEGAPSSEDCEETAAMREVTRDEQRTEVDDGKMEKGDGGADRTEGSASGGREVEANGSSRYVDTSSTPGQEVEGDVDTSSTPGQAAEGDVDTSSTPGQEVEGDVDTSSTLVRETKEQALLLKNEREGEGQSSEEGERSDTNQTSQNFPPVRVLVHTTAGQVVEPSCEHDDDPYSTSSTNPGSHDNVVSMDMTLATMSDTTHNMDMTTCMDPFTEDVQPQEIVPDELMDLYLSMTDSAKSQTVDSDLPYYCAFCLPGVLLTLGAENWPILRTTFLTLSGDLQWKIRRVLAYSLHELAHILGPQTTIVDLFPTFQEYCTKDVDDVKIGTLSHLTEFFDVLPLSLRHSCLPSILEGLQEVENPKNWRYRHTLVEQLVSLCDFYDADYLHSHIYPVARQLTDDKVAEVRHSATQLLGMILQRLTQITPDGYLPLLREMKADYASHRQWNFRQLYIHQCTTFLVEKCISSEVFVSECLPSLLSLVSDKVPNVRLALARAVRETLMNTDHFLTERRDILDQLDSVLTTLQSDRDRDVIYFAGGDVSSFERHHLYGDSRYRTYSQASEDQFHDALETQEGGRPLSDREAWLRSWEEALSGPTLQMTGEMR